MLEPMRTDPTIRKIDTQACAVLGNLENEHSLSFALRIEIEEVVERAFEIAYQKPTARILAFPSLVPDAGSGSLG